MINMINRSTRVIINIIKCIIVTINLNEKHCPRRWSQAVTKEIPSHITSHNTSTHGDKYVRVVEPPVLLEPVSQNPAGIRPNIKLPMYTRKLPNLWI